MYVTKNYIKYILITLFYPTSWCQIEDWDIDTVNTSLLDYQVELSSDGYIISWGISFLPDGDLLVSDISGKIYRVNKDGNDKILFHGLPKVYYRGQAGLLDIEIHPDFEQNRLNYFYLSDIHKNLSFTSFASRVLVNDKLESIKTIYKAPLHNFTNCPYHFGSRILLDKGYIYFTVGDKGNMNDAQDISKPNGKIHLLFDNGLVPKSNPFKNLDGSTSSVWCYGNVNLQGLAIDIRNNILSLEHGPKVGDELNFIRKGNNYGWPIITYGINYDGTSISDKTHYEGMKQPIWYWTPSIAVCGMKFYYGEMFESWNGNILVT